MTHHLSPIRPRRAAGLLVYGPDALADFVTSGLDSATDDMDELQPRFEAAIDPRTGAIRVHVVYAATGPDGQPHDFVETYLLTVTPAD
jgi:hypothetical protein